MSKRFTDTNKYRKPFVRGLQGAYKLLWDYLYHDCDHAGIWIVDFEVAQLFIGKDMPVNKEEALRFFNNGEIRIIEIDHGKKWFIKPFIEFQYGELSENNRAHKSVINILKKYNLYNVKGSRSPLQGAMDKDMDKDKDKDSTYSADFEKFWTIYPSKVGKGKAYESWQKLKPSPELQAKMIEAVKKQSLSPKWADENGKYIPNPATWLNQRRWDDNLQLAIEISNPKEPINKSAESVRRISAEIDAREKLTQGVKK